MSKKILAALLAVLMVLSLVPMTALAETADVGETCTNSSCSHAAEYAGKHYNTLQGAIDAAESDTTASTPTVKLVNDITNLTTSVIIKKSMTVDFNGKSISVTGDQSQTTVTNLKNASADGNPYIIIAGVKGTKAGSADTSDTAVDITLQNAKITHDMTGNQGRAILVGPNVTLTVAGDQTAITTEKTSIVSVGKLIVNAGTITCKTTVDANPAILVGSTAKDFEGIKDSSAEVTGAIINNSVGIGISSVQNGTVTVNEGTKITSGNSALSGNNTAPTQNFVVKGGELTSTTTAAVYKPASGSLKIEGGTFTGKAGVVVRAGSVEMTGGTIIANGDADVQVGASGTAAVPPAGIVYDTATKYKDTDKAPKINVSGNAVVRAAAGQETVTVVVAEDDTTTVPSEKLEVSGGSFSSPVSFEYLNETLKYEAENRNNIETPYTYHSTAAAATVAASGGKVKTTNAVSGAGFDWGWQKANERIASLKEAVVVDNVEVATAIESEFAGKDALDQTLFFRFDNLTAGTQYKVEILNGTTEVDSFTFKTGANQTQGILRNAYATKDNAETVITPKSELTLNLYEISGENSILVGEGTVNVDSYSKPETSVEKLGDGSAAVSLKLGTKGVHGTGLLGDYTVKITKDGEAVSGASKQFGANASKITDDGKGRVDELFEIPFTFDTPLGDGLYQFEVFVGRTNDSGNVAENALFTVPFAIGNSVKTTATPETKEEVTLSSSTQKDATFTLTNEEKYDAETRFEVYLDEALRTKANNVTAEIANPDEDEDAPQKLKLYVDQETSLEGTYYVVATEAGKMPSAGGKFIVNAYNSNPSVPPLNPPDYTPVDPNAPTVTIGVTQPENGTLSVEPKQAKAGEQVTVTVTPSEKYYVATSVTVKGDTTATATKNADGTFTFTMPAGNTVTVSAEIKHIFDLFTDVPADSFYADPVKWAVEQSITLGNSTDYSTFGTTASCTRKEMVLFLYRAAGEPAVTGSSNSFADITGSQYDAYRNAIQWAVDNGITQGTSETTFDPDAVCSRSQMVTFLYRYDQEPTVTGSNSFVDVPADAFYKTAVQWAVNKGVTQGTNAAGTTFEPYTACSRGQMVTFLYRYMGE